MYEIKKSPPNANRHGYLVEVVEDGIRLYWERFDKYKMDMYDKYINARVSTLLQDCGKLHEPFVMFELGNRMYRVTDSHYIKSHRVLQRQCEPIEYKVEEPFTMDFIMDSTLHDLFVYPQDCLVYRFDKLYINGQCLGDPNMLVSIWGLTNVYFEYGYGSGFKEFIKCIKERMGVEVIQYEGPGCSSYFERSKK